jgi:heme/copper-type cytochrome/quinol oxidase subunit 2
MKERNRVLLLILIMTFISLNVVGVATYLLYKAAIDEERARLTETAQGQARLIEAVARFDTVYSKD